MYLPPSYELVKGQDSVKFHNVFRGLLSLVFFDPVYYEKSYPDLVGIKTKDLQNHFISIGFFENRFPFQPLFDFEFIRLNYPDLEEFGNQDLINHFLFYGYKEGRLSSLPMIDFDFYLDRYSFSIDKDIYNSKDERGLVKHFLDVGYKSFFLPYPL